MQLFSKSSVNVLLYVHNLKQYLNINVKIIFSEKKSKLVQNLNVAFLSVKTFLKC